MAPPPGSFSSPGPYDPTSVACALPHHPGALDRLSELVRDCVWSIGSVAIYAAAITETHRLRLTLDASANIVDACYDRQDPTVHIDRLADLWPHQAVTGEVA